MGMGFAPTWLRQVSPSLLHKTTLTTDLHQCCYEVLSAMREIVPLPKSFTDVDFVMLQILGHFQ